jgi:trypsin
MKFTSACLVLSQFHLAMGDPAKLRAQNIHATRSTPIGAAEPRIVGGIPADPDAFPFFAASASDYSMCGASLIHPDLLLTAAHCFGAFDEGVRIGVSDRMDPASGTTRQVVRHIKHARYNSQTTANDIMLLKLDEPVGDGIPVVPWARSASLPIADEVLTVMGFGLMSEEGYDEDLPQLLQRVDVPALADETCSDQYFGEVDLEVMFCAGEGGKDSCQGDSGGPIINQENVQVGIVSWGWGCGRPENAGIYTRVGAFSDWIERMICEHSGVPPADCPEVAVPEQGDLTARFEIQFDTWPEETSWVLVEHGINGDEDRTILEGPEFFANAEERWEATFPMKSDHEYTFTLTDSVGDGFDGSFVINSITSDGSEQNLLMGPDSTFEYTYEANFSASGPRNPCNDSSKIFYLEGEVYGSCNVLEGSFEYLCNFADVALACPLSCRVCSAQKVVTEQECAEDRPGMVHMGEFFGNRDCAWLQQGRERASLRVSSICDLTDVAFHCPLTCNSCEKNLGSGVVSSDTTEATIQGLISINYDAYPEETTWTLAEMNSDGINLVILTGAGVSTSQTGSGSATEQESFFMKPGHEYVFTLLDSYGDGFDGLFEIERLHEDGVHSALASGPETPLEYRYVVSFVAPEN